MNTFPKIENMSTKKPLLSTLVVVILLGISQMANAQAALIALLFGDKVATEEFNISMEFGVNFSHFSELPDSKQYRHSINFGIAGNLMLSDNWYLSPTAYFLSGRNVEINSYSLNSDNAELNDVFSDESATLNLKYIDVPILFAYQTNNKKFRFGAGPQISFLTGANMDISSDYGDFSEEYKSQVNNIDY